MPRRKSSDITKAKADYDEDEDIANEIPLRRMDQHNASASTSRYVPVTPQRQSRAPTTTTPQGPVRYRVTPGKRRAIQKSSSADDDNGPDWRGEMQSETIGVQRRSSQDTLPRPPSFAESQLQTIIRRQRKRRIVSPQLERIEAGQVHFGGFGGVGAASLEIDGRSDGMPTIAGPYVKVGRNRSGPARAGPLNSYEFAGWGSMSMLEISEQEVETARRQIAERPSTGSEAALLGQFRAMAIAGNAVTGSIFYALPSVFAVSGVFAPVCLLLAALLMTPTLLVIHSLASSLPGTNAYSYMLNLGGRPLALVAGAVTILDAVSTGAVSSTTAASYVSVEAQQVPAPVWAVIFLATLTAICLLGLRESSSVALGMFTLHIAAIIALMIAAIVTWSKEGTSILAANWHDALHVATSAAHLGGKGVARSLFDGTALAFVGLTGFETTVAYASSVKRRSFPLALRNIWLVVALLEAPMALLVLALLPFDSILSANNVLASLASAAAGRGLQVFIIVDAAIVLCGGIITGAISCCAVLISMSDDGTLPRRLGWLLDKSQAPAICLGSYLCLCLLVCATSRFSQLMLSSIFSLVFLAVLALFSICTIMTLYARPLLPRRRISLVTMLASLVVTLTSLVGNTIISPVSLAQTVAYIGVVTALLMLWANRVPLVRIAGVWLPNQVQSIRRWAPLVEKRATQWVRSQRGHTKAVFLTSTDDLSTLISAVLYISDNEPCIGHVVLVHCYRRIEEIPAELEANHQLVDEAFPTITVELLFVDADFGPTILQVLSTRLDTPLSRFCIGCPSTSSPSTHAPGTTSMEHADSESPSVSIVHGEPKGWKLEDLGGVRIIMD